MDPAATFAAINWLAVLAATVATFLIGALWYGPIFGSRWLEATGLHEDEIRQANNGRIFGTAFILQLLAAVALAMFIGEATLAFGVFAGFMTGAFFVSTALGVVYTFEQRPLGLWAMDAGYQVIGFTVMGAILGAW